MLCCSPLPVCWHTLYLQRSSSPITAAQFLQKTGCWCSRGLWSLSICLFADRWQLAIGLVVAHRADAARCSTVRCHSSSHELDYYRHWKMLPATLVLGTLASFRACAESESSLAVIAGGNIGTRPTRKASQPPENQRLNRWSSDRCSLADTGCGVGFGLSVSPREAFCRRGRSVVIGAAVTTTRWVCCLSGTTQKRTRVGSGDADSVVLWISARHTGRSSNGNGRRRNPFHPRNGIGAAARTEQSAQRWSLMQ